MIRTRLVAGLSAAGLLAFALPAQAQNYSQEFQLAKVTKQGATSHNIAGSGVVTVQVQVNADGSHKAIKVLNSTNSGDNQAAMDIAQNSTYSPATRGGKPTSSFYDFKLKFNGKAVVQDQEESAVSTEAGGADTSQIDTLLHAGKYSDAIAKANSALLSSPGNPAILQMLGLAQFFNGDSQSAAATFSKVSDIKKPFQSAAAQSFAKSAVQLSGTNPAQSLDYAHRAIEIQNDTNAKFALGVAELANKQYSDAVLSLKAAHDALNDPKMKVQVDQELLQAYLSQNDETDANTTASEMKSLDPSGGTLAAHAIAQHYLKLGSDAYQAKDYATAEKNFAAAGEAGGSADDTVTAYKAAASSVLNTEKPDVSKLKDYALKAQAAAPNDAEANFYAGVAYEYSYSASKSADDKKQALSYLNKADDLAKAAGNAGLSIQIEKQIKNINQ
jgi:TonB family protein